MFQAFRDARLELYVDETTVVGTIPLDCSFSPGINWSMSGATRLWSCSSTRLYEDNTLYTV